jgi:MFS family permease
MTGRPSEEESDPRARPENLREAYRVLGLLFVIFVINFADRHVLFILSEPIKRDLSLTDTQVGLLSGAFALFYVTAGLPIARWADTGSRASVISLGMAVWSALTVVCGFARNFPQLLAARVGVGIGEAACTPAAHSILSDLFPTSHRGRAFAIYGMGGSIGGMVGIFVGGHMADLFDWRVAFFVMGVPGLLLALVARYALPDPPRTARGTTSVSETVRFFWSQRALRHLLVGSALHAFAIIGVSAFNSMFFIRVHGLSTGQTATIMTLMALFGTTAGSYAGGLLTDRFGERDLRWYLWLPAIATAISIPFSGAYYFVPVTTLAALFGGLASGLGSFYSGPAAAMTQALVPSSMRAQASAAFLLFNSLVGMGLGPIAVGAISDRLEPTLGAESLRYALLLVCVTNAWAAVHFTLGAKTLREEVSATRALEAAIDA